MACFVPFAGPPDDMGNPCTAGLSNGDMADEHRRWRKVQDGKVALREMLEGDTGASGGLDSAYALCPALMTGA